MAKDRYLNRDIGWLQFNERVLYQAEDKNNPLLERVKFINIFQSNLDEFFMKRVGGLQNQQLSNLTIPSHGGLSVVERLNIIRSKVLEHHLRINHLLDKEILPELRNNKIYLLNWDELDKEQLQWCDEFFHSKIFPIVTPMVVDQGHPFPLLSNLSTSLAAAICNPGETDPLFARVKIPNYFPEWIQVKDKRYKDEFVFVHMIDLMAANLSFLFPKMCIEGVMPFKVTRNVDIESGQEDAEDLLDLIQEEIKNRKFSEVVRLEHGPNPHPWLLEFVCDNLEISEEEVYSFPMDLRFRELSPISDLILPELRQPPWIPVVPSVFQQDDDVSIFQVMKAGDILVHHPYESFTASVEKFIRSSAQDPSVVAIKITLYRTNKDSAVIKALIEAAERGKQVVCLVELKARFDEERNIFWAQELEKAGVHVIYGMVGMKIHSKITLVVRREGSNFRLYAHVGTGNYNASTAGLYTDLGLLTADPTVTNELVEVFHFLTGRSLKSDYKKLLVAPVCMKTKFLELLAQERKNSRKGLPTGVVAKMNSLEDKDIIKALYKTSEAGVSIVLNVRGFSCLRPQIPNISENIRVYSIVGPFLEHARVFHFRNGANTPEEGHFIIGSGDWMSRNLHRRVEVALPIEDSKLRKRLWSILNVQQQDNCRSWDLQFDGSYKRRIAKNNRKIDSQKILMGMAIQRASFAPVPEPGHTEQVETLVNEPRSPQEQ